VDIGLPKVTRYADFWPIYLREHSRPATRYVHYADAWEASPASAWPSPAQPWWIPGAWCRLRRRLDARTR
jgi:hypothetical protein